MTNGEEGFSRLQLWVMLFLASIALTVSGYLAWHGFRMTPVAGCGGGSVFNCDHVLTSKWSKFMGVPVAAFAVLTYTGLLALLASYATARTNVMRTSLQAPVAFVCGIAGLAAIWFTSLQVLVLGHLCAYCLLAHACGLGLLLIATFGGNRLLVRRPVLSVAGVALVSSIAIAQWQTEAPPTYVIQEFEITESDDQPEMLVPEVISPFDFDESELLDDEENGDVLNPDPAQVGQDEQAGSVEDELVMPVLESTGSTFYPYAATLLQLAVMPYELQLLGVVADEVQASSAKMPPPRQVSFGRIATLRTDHWPIIGDKQAPRVTAEMFDYTCPSCRATAPALEKAFEDFKGELAIIALPVPINRNCNATVETTPAGHEQACELAKTAISVWLVKPDKFAEFHHWMMQGEKAPSVAAAQAHAKKLVGERQFVKVYGSSRPGKYIQANIRIYKMAGKGQIPKLLLKKTSLVGKATSADVIKNLVNRD